MLLHQGRKLGWAPTVKIVFSPPRATSAAPPSPMLRRRYLYIGETLDLLFVPIIQTPWSVLLSWNIARPAAPPVSYQLIWYRLHESVLISTPQWAEELKDAAGLSPGAAPSEVCTLYSYCDMFGRTEVNTRFTTSSLCLFPQAEAAGNNETH